MSVDFGRRHAPCRGSLAAAALRSRQRRDRSGAGGVGNAGDEAATGAACRRRRRPGERRNTVETAVIRPWPLWSYGLTLIAVICGAAPLLAGHPAALEDWPSHVARIEILTQMLAGNAYWGQFYRINTFLIPNVSVDLVSFALHALGLSVAVAAEVTLIAIYVLFVGAAAALALALRVADPLRPLCAVVLFYNGALMDGFVNYMMGTAVALSFLAAWVATSRPVWRGTRSRRWVVSRCSSATSSRLDCSCACSDCWSLRHCCGCGGGVRRVCVALPHRWLPRCRC